ncbi:mitosis inhibitor protein kinase [Podospora aff. communis PSN243]|uniref:Mitosis inhibitor protein kinase n=1 Tax=Podospora aff. communis PSN243 TaxID=3040156 RepID=A0AAV9GJT3_9PEZI|nr:mitosis inhibitor protein kinase [Podospora aff. communis PSN243]
MSYSNGSGGTLTLPSPTHVHHVDVGSAVRSLRRSLSRSPSKFRLTTTPTGSPGHEVSSKLGAFLESTTPPSPEGRSAPVTSATESTTSVSTPAGFPSFLTPQPSHTSTTNFRSSVKLSLRSARTKPSTSRPLSRTRVSPKSPLKRVIGSSADSGNSVTSTAEPEPQNQDHPTFSEFALALSPVSRRNLEKPSRHSMHLDVSGSSKTGISKFLGSNADTFASISVSPLKRSDAMIVDPASPGSPVAKRRSLHGISNMSSAFNIFDMNLSQANPVNPQGFDIHEDGNHEYQLSGSMASPFRDPLPSPTPLATVTNLNLPKRTSSLRKSTLQQRHGDTRTSWGRRAGEKQLAQLSNENATPAARNRPRLSLDQYLPPDDRGSPFLPQAPLPNPSAHPLPRPANQPHPLSRTITQSSSSSSVPDDSPTHFPVQFAKPRAPMNFSKSLPPGSHRPAGDAKVMETPDYKRAKPLQSAFMSTGLVSKMNRNPEFGPPKLPGTKVAAMPDTPCKKQYNSATYPPSSGGGRRPSRPSFGSPSTPFSSSITAPNRGNIFGTRDKPAGLFFQPNRAAHARKASLLSVDGEEHGEIAGSQDDFPPTPTKNFLKFGTPAPETRTPQVARVSLFAPSTYAATEEPAASPNCKFVSLPHVIGEGTPAKSDRLAAVMGRPSTPTPSVTSRFATSLTSLRGRQAAHWSLGTPAAAKTVPKFGLSHPSDAETMTGIIRADATTPASPLHPAGFNQSSPQTPQDSMAPPDASRLSISGAQDDKSRLARTPATPTMQGRHMFSAFGDPRLSRTPQNENRAKDVDESLLAHFDKSEIIGKGEFSQVYRVVKTSASGSAMAPFTTTPSRGTPTSPDEGKVYAVKKLRLPFAGVKAREAKLREVAILKALGNSDKVVHYIDDWELDGHLYIQTEFCSEGGLDSFLRLVGQAGKLDDFRVWKILHETLQGLDAIHDAGFIHLDLKPANIFITFDGYLKIGDFGMAVEWPAEKGVEGEGDREYIAPEILLGQIDKPADIFALGLIMLETACNVYLPDNGPAWQALRSGDLSNVGTLTSGEANVAVRDANGIPIEHESNISPGEDGELSIAVSPGALGKLRGFPFGAMTHDPSNLFGAQRRREERTAPDFMKDPENPSSLDNLVRRMLSPNPVDRPTAKDLLATYSIAWVNDRRKAGATVYEGNWGPEPPTPEPAYLDDTEMIDV